MLVKVWQWGDQQVFLYRPEVNRPKDFQEKRERLDEFPKSRLPEIPSIEKREKKVAN